MSTDVKTYIISEQDKHFYTAILLLDNMINRQQYYPIIDKYNFLEPYFAKLMAADRVKIDDGKYVPTPEGRDFLQKFMNRYYEYIKVYDVYCAVDTETGEFAFSSYYDIHTGDNPDAEAETWARHLNNTEKWLDLRVAVAEFKKLNPVELVFMSFINEDRFDVNKDGWEFDVVTGLFWDPIVDIVKGSLTQKMVDDAGHDISLIIQAGAEVNVNLCKIEEEIAEQNAAAEEEVWICDDCGCEEDDCECEEEYEEVVTYVEIIEEPYYEIDYYEAYYDPFYVSPVWDPWYDPYYYY